MAPPNKVPGRIRRNQRLFWRREFDPPPDNGRGFSIPRLNFSTTSLFQRRKKWKLPSYARKARLPLKKGGREGFLERPFQKAKGLPKFQICLNPFPSIISDDYRRVRIRQSRKNPFRTRIFLLPTPAYSINILGSRGKESQRIAGHGMALLLQPEFLPQKPGR